MLEPSDGKAALSGTLPPVVTEKVPSTDDVLLLIAKGAETGRFDLDRIRLMKAAFLVAMRGPEAWQNQFSFRPYTYGPFDAGIYRARDSLMERDLLRSDGGRYDSYVLTDAGHGAVDGIEQGVGENRASWVRGIGEWVTSRSFASLIQSIYAEYPDYARDSALVRG